MRSLLPVPRYLTAVALAVLCVGCEKKNPPDPNAAGPAPPVAGQTGPPLTEADYKEFGEKLEKAVAKGEKAEVIRLFRMSDLVERSISDLGLSPDEKRGALKTAAGMESQFADQLIQPASQGGSYQLVNVRTVDGRPRVLLRLLSPEGAVNYHEFTLARYPDGKVAAEDIYVYASGETLTQTLRRLLLGAGINLKRLDQLTASQKVLMENMGTLTTMSKQLREGQFKEVLAKFRALPAELQKEKVFQLFAIQAASGTGSDADYLKEMERFRRDHPNDPAGDLVSIDYYVLKKQYDEVLKLTDRLDKALGGDPYMDVLRANMYSEAKRYKEARAAIEKAAKGIPKLPQVYWTGATIAAEENDYAGTATWFKKLVETTGEPLVTADLAQDDRFKAFARSPQFAELKKWLANRKK